MQRLSSEDTSRQKVNLVRLLQKYVCTNWLSVGPDLGPNCLQRLSAEDTSRQTVNLVRLLQKYVCTDWHSVGPDLGPTCLQRLSADDIGQQRVNLVRLLQKYVCTNFLVLSYKAIGKILVIAFTLQANYWPELFLHFLWQEDKLVEHFENFLSNEIVFILLKIKQDDD